EAIVKLKRYQEMGSNNDGGGNSLRRSSSCSRRPAVCTGPRVSRPNSVALDGHSSPFTKYLMSSEHLAPPRCTVGLPPRPLTSQSSNRKSHRVRFASPLIQSPMVVNPYHELMPSRGE